MGRIQDNPNLFLISLNIYKGWEFFGGGGGTVSLSLQIMQ